jgi:hypothetical protein
MMGSDPRDIGQPRPGAAHFASGGPQPATLSEVSGLLGEFRALLRHVLRRPMLDAGVSNQPALSEKEGGSVLSLPGVHVELLIRTPEEIASDDVLLEKLCLGIVTLTRLAAPATVSSIYLTSVFVQDEMSPDASGAAKSAAGRLRRWAITTVLLALFFFFMTVMLLIHVDRGRREMEQLQHVRDEYQLVLSAVDQAHDPSLLSDCLKGLAAIETDVNHQPICNRLRDSLRRMQIARTQLWVWNSISDRLNPFWPPGWFDHRFVMPPGLSEEQWGASDLRSATLLAGFTGFVLPMLLGLLGAFTYVYRDIDRRVRSATLLPGDGAHGTLRILLGAILGGLLGVVWTNGQPIELEGVTLSLAALAFFVGFSVEVVFNVLDSIVARTANMLRK